jgi:hypothetical protein
MRDLFLCWQTTFLYTLLFASSLIADTVILKNKTVHKGKVSFQNESSLTQKKSLRRRIGFFQMCDIERCLLG